MKFAVLALALLFAVLQIDARYLITEEVDVDEEECFKKLNINKDDPDQSKDDDITLCYYTKKGVLLPNGDINYDRMLEPLLEPVRAEHSQLVFETVKNMYTEAMEECRESLPTFKSVSEKLLRTIECIQEKGQEKSDAFNVQER